MKVNSVGDFKYFLAIFGVIAGVAKVVTTALGGLPNPLPSQTRWRKMITLKGELIELSYLRAIKKLRSHENKSGLAYPLEQQVYKDSVECLIARHVDVKYEYNFTGAYQAFVLCIFWLILSFIMIIEFPLSDSSLSMQVIASFVVLLIAISGIFIFSLLFVLSISDGASIVGSVNSVRRKKILKRNGAQEVSLSRLQNLLLKKVEFIFVDGTVCSGFQMSRLGGSSGVISLCCGPLEKMPEGLVAREW